MVGFFYAHQKSPAGDLVNVVWQNSPAARYQWDVVWQK
jgi:hypothetical protein